MLLSPHVEESRKIRESRRNLLVGMNTGVERRSTLFHAGICIHPHAVTHAFIHAIRGVGL